VSASGAGFLTGGWENQTLPWRDTGHQGKPYRKWKMTRQSMSVRDDAFARIIHKIVAKKYVSV
jgi:hypothetical protein